MPNIIFPLVIGMQHHDSFYPAANTVSIGSARLFLAIEFKVLPKMFRDTSACAIWNTALSSIISVHVQNRLALVYTHWNNQAVQSTKLNFVDCTAWFFKTVFTSLVNLNACFEIVKCSNILMPTWASTSPALWTATFATSNQFRFDNSYLLHLKLS